MASDEFSFEIGFFENLHQRIPKDIRVASILANLYTKVGQIDLGLKMDRKLVRLTPKDPMAFYNLACSLALKGRKRDSVEALRIAVSFGYKDFSWMKTDPDLDNIRDYRGYEALISELGSSR